MPKRVTSAGQQSHHHDQNTAVVTPGVGCGRSSGEGDAGGLRPSSPFAALSLRRTRFSSVPLVHIKNAETDEIPQPSSAELPRRHVTFLSDADSNSSLSGGGLCSMSDTMESFKDSSGSPTIQPSVRIKHLTRNSDDTSRFPKLDECAHFHYDNVELGPIEVALCESEDSQRVEGNKSGGTGTGSAVGEWWFCAQVSSNGKRWQIRRSLDNFHMLDRQLHRCVYDRKFSLLTEIDCHPQHHSEDALKAMLTQYLERFSQLAGSLINCGPVLNWLELDNRGNRLIVTDEAAINTPAVAAAYVIKRYASQATDEISLEVEDIISVIDMPPPEESTWWRGKKGFQVGFFPCECVEIIGDKVPHSIKFPKTPSKPVLRKHGKLIAFFRSFLLSRPSRRKLKQSGILKERVFGCDLGEHLMNTGRDVPLVLKSCTEFIEQYGIVDGIYRLSGVTSNIQKLRHAFDEDRVPNLLDEAILQDIHCVASLLKMYFRELPNPLLTFHLYDKFVCAVQAEEDLRLLMLRDVVQQLPPPHYRTLEYLMRHLSKVAGHGSQTGMTPKNVAIVWAPNLLRSREIENGGVSALHVVGVQAVLTEYLIRYTDIIFSEKMPIFPSPKLHEVETPKKTRPKSLAISTPTRLLSLEEARSRALTSNLPGDHQKFIDVGGGEENLPIKYHTIIELPSRRSIGKGKKSPSSWKSFFQRGWHTTSGRRKNRRDRSERPKIGSPIFLDKSPLNLQEKAITESEMTHGNSKKLRTVKSAENLVPMNMETAVKNICSPVEENASSPMDYSPTTDFPSTKASPSKSPSYQKHMRSTSHDSYFEHIIEIREEEDSELHQKEAQMEGDTPEKSHSKNQEEGLNRKMGQKQKLVSFENEASSPKVQKLSSKRLSYNFDLCSDAKCDFLNAEDIQCSKMLVHAQSTGESQRNSAQSVATCSSYGLDTRAMPLSEQATSSSESGYVLNNSHDVVAEIHEYASESRMSCDNDLSLKSEDDLREGRAEYSVNYSMEATISESASVNQLLSFDSRDQSIPQSVERQSGFSYVQDSSLATPESPTGDNVSEIPSSGGSEIGSNPDLCKPSTPKDFVSELENKHLLGDGGKCVLMNVDEQLACQTKHLQIKNSPKIPSESSSVIHSLPKFSTSGSSIVEDVILSPPENFGDKNKSPTEVKTRNHCAEKVKTSAQSPRTMERSRTELHEICPKFVSGIAVSGSYAQELFRANSDVVGIQNVFKRRSCSSKLSPVSPIEDSKRRFESEIGRLIVRDRQMKLEMERMKAETQKKKTDLPVVSETDRGKPKSEKKAEAVNFRRSPVKSFERNGKEPESDGFIKNLKDTIEDKKQFSDSSNNNAFTNFLRMENKPTVKELLSKFEGQINDNVPVSPKHGTAMFTNVQVINHNFSSAPSKAQDLNFNDSKQDSSSIQNSNSREHIFQTECVIRFPNPKVAPLILNSKGSPVQRNCDDINVPRTQACGLWGTSAKSNDSHFTNDLSTLPKDAASAESIEHSKVDSSTSKPLQNGKHSESLNNKTPNSESDAKPFTGFTDTFNRATRASVRLRNEFLQSAFPVTTPESPEGYSSWDRFSRSPTETRKRHGQTRQRPKSVPPPISRLSLSGSTHSGSRLQSNKSSGSCDTMPKGANSVRNGRDSVNASQTNGPPKRVRERAAAFERSLSFSSADRKNFSIAKHSPKAQDDSSNR